MKLEELSQILAGYGEMVLAFSGGKDSSLLLAIGSEVIEPDRLVAVTAVSPIKREEELSWASKLGRKLGVDHVVIHTTEYQNPVFINQPSQRCQICKQELYDNMARIAAGRNIANLVDGANFEDTTKPRPVDEIAALNSIKQPLIEAELSSADVSLLLEHMGLKEYIRPHHSSCKPWEIIYPQGD